MIARMSLRTRTALVVLSGALVWPLTYLDDLFLGPVGYTLTGAIFGALVLAPFVGTKTWWYGRVGGLVLGSIVVYALAVELAADGYGPLDLDSNVTPVVSGVVGALLVGALTKVLAPVRTPVKFWLYLLVAGALGGYIFRLLLESDYGFVVSLGYAAWQVTVFVALYFGSNEHRMTAGSAG